MCVAPCVKDPSIPEVLDIVLKKLDELTLAIRDPGISSSTNKINTNIVGEFTNSLTTLGAITTENIQIFSKALLQITNNFNALKKNERILQKALNSYKEETDILSWLFGEWSNDLKKPLNKNIKQTQIAFVIGKELADLVKQVPGPYAAKAFVTKMLNKCKADKNNATLLEMIDSLSMDWKKQLSDDIVMINNGECTPILMAILKSVETGQPEVWKHVYKVSLGIDPEEVLNDPINWGYQIYLECLLTKNYISES